MPLHRSPLQVIPPDLPLCTCAYLCPTNSTSLVLSPRAQLPISLSHTHTHTHTHTHREREREREGEKERGRKRFLSRMGHSTQWVYVLIQISLQNINTMNAGTCFVLLTSYIHPEPVPRRLNKYLTKKWICISLSCYQMLRAYSSVSILLMVVFKDVSQVFWTTVKSG